MKTRLMLNLALLAIIVVLGAVAFFKPGKQAPESKPLLTLDANALTRVTLQNKETLVFEKTGGLWRLTAPFAAPVNQVRVGQLLEVAKAKSEAEYPVKPEDLAQFGLDKPQASLTLGDNSLQFGGTDPINLRRYVRLGDTLHLVDDNFYHHLTAPATDYVDKKLLPEGARIREIQLPGLKAVKGSDGKWTAEPPGDGKTDLGVLASAWATARAIDVKRLEQAEVLGETIRIGLVEGEPVEYVILQKQPYLMLARKDWRLQYEITAESSRELLNQPRPEPPKPPAGPAGAADEPHGDDHDEEDADVPADDQDLDDVDEGEQAHDHDRD